ASDAEAEASRRIQRAKELREQSNIPEAKAHLEIARRELWSLISGHNRYRILAELGLCDDHDGYHEAAALQLLDAKQYDPDNPKARSLEAYALHALGRDAEARDLAESILQSNPSQDVAAQVWVLTAPPESKFIDVEKHLIPAVREHAGVAIALASLAANEQLVEKTIAYIRLAIKAYPDDANILSVASQSLFKIATLDYRHVRASQPLADPQGLLNEAMHHIENALNQLGQQGPPVRISALLANRAQIHSSLGRSQEARVDLERAIAISPDDEEIRLIHWRYLIDRNQFKEATETTDPSRFDNSSRQLLLAHASSLSAIGDDENQACALRVLREAHCSWPETIDEAAIGILDLLVELECVNKSPENARDALNKVKEQLPDWHADILLAEIHISEGDKEESIRIAKMVAGRVSPGPDLKMNYRIAYLMSCLEMHAEEFAYLKAISPPDCVGPLTYQLLECASKCNDRAFIKEYCGHLRNNGYVDTRCLEY
ncbi:MAG: tetratricopeptide repeat protein, partial [Desulfobacterales bacterium]|nr:tetratricopeptide repeat protein [Desulfobacterales bacterium]